MFIAAYIIILCLSAGFVAWALTVASLRAATLLETHKTLAHGTVALVCAIAFLLVVGAPGNILVGALALLGAAYAITRRHHLHVYRFGVPLAAVALGALSLTLAPALGLPTIAIGFLAAACWLGITLSGEFLPGPFATSMPAIAMTLLPLVAAPLLGAPSYLAIDAALILAAATGVALVSSTSAIMGVSRTALAYLIGWLILTATLHGAWIAAAASLMIWIGNLAFHMARDPSRKNNAFTF